MDKKVAFAICAVVAFMGGAIWVSEVPTVGTLVAFLEAAIGFTCGFFFKKAQDEEKFNLWRKELARLEEEIDSLKAKKVKTTSPAVKRTARK